jgi:hypothetical protein
MLAIKHVQLLRPQWPHSVQLLVLCPPVDFMLGGVLTRSTTIDDPEGKLASLVGSCTIRHAWPCGGESLLTLSGIWSRLQLARCQFGVVS